LAKNTSLNALTLTINSYSDWTDEWAFYPRNGLAKNTSLNALTLTINNYSDMGGVLIHHTAGGLADSLAKNTSLNALTLTINNDGDVSVSDWVFGLGEGVAKNTSINTLTLTINNYSDHEVSCDWVGWLVDDLAEKKSLSTFNLTVNMCSKMIEDWLPRLCHALIRSESVTTLRLQVNNQCVTSGSPAYDFSKLLVNCRSLALLDLTVSFYGVADSSSA